MEESELVKHAREQLVAANYYSDSYGALIADSVIDLVKLFDEQNHSGFSANLTMRLFSKLAMWKTLDD